MLPMSANRIAMRKATNAHAMPYYNNQWPLMIYYVRLDLPFFCRCMTSFF